MKKILFFLLVAGMMTACTNDDEGNSPAKAEPIVLSAPEKVAAVAEGSFSWEFFNRLQDFEHQNYNSVYSPLGVCYVLSLIANEDSMARETCLAMLGMESSGLDGLNQYNKKITAALTTIDRSVSMEIANAIWTAPSYELSQGVEAALSDYYAIDMFKIKSSSFERDVDSWCSKKTHGKINKLGLQYNPDLISLLVNAIYFNGKWAENCKFDKKDTKTNFFNNIDGTKSTVSFMNQHTQLKYASNECVEMCALPFGNGAFNICLILPQEGKDLDESVESLCGDRWADLVTASEYVGVQLSLPRFEMSIDHRFTDLLDQMSKELSEDCQVFGKNVRGMAQNMYFRIDEEGVEAAAVTYTDRLGAYTPRGVKLNFNRPFLFAVTEQSTGTILFLGKVSKL